jgi:hypothetical protein
MGNKETELETITIVCDDYKNFLEKPQPSIPMAPMGRSDNGGSSGSTDDDIVGMVGDKKVRSLNLKRLRPHINNTIKAIVSLIDEQPITQSGYEVSELEFNIGILGETSVSLFSVLSAGVSANSGLTVRIKKKGT